MEPFDGQTCGQLTYSTRYHAWLYVGSYDDLALCLRRAQALEDGWKLAFDCLYVEPEDPTRGTLIPGWYAFTEEDPRAARIGRQNSMAERIDLSDPGEVRDSDDQVVSDVKLLRHMLKAAHAAIEQMQPIVEGVAAGRLTDGELVVDDPELLFRRAEMFVYGYTTVTD